MPTYDIAVIGAGILGLASARELLLRFPRLRVAVLDKEPAIARHQTGHNSGVIHSGIYYAPGSLKARLCVAGSADMYTYCQTKGIPAEGCGKLIVAVTENERPGLHTLFARGQANQVPDLRLLGPSELRTIEPHCVGVEAIWSPGTGIVDYSRVASAYAGDVVESDGEILLSRTVSGITRRSDGVTLHTTRGDVTSRYVVACAGLQADAVARFTAAAADPRIVPFRGDYWVLRPQRSYLARNLIYPVPDPSFPFLGVHFTRRIQDGSVWLGPNAVLAFAREGYRRTDLNVRELGETLRFQGFQRLARRYWRTGLAELARDVVKNAFLASLQRYVPELQSSDLLPGPAGVRAQALDSDGQLVDDFVINAQERQVIHVRNAPSPAATSSLSIARLIADTATDVFGLSAPPAVFT